MAAHEKNINKRLKVLYPLNLERALIISLVFLIALFHLLPKRVIISRVEQKSVALSFNVEDIPRTRQMVRKGRPQPRRPVIPIPVEEPDVPEDATIDSTNIHWDLGDSPFGRAGLTSGRSDTIPPRPLVQVMPEYPERLKTLNVAGDIRLMVKVDENGDVKDVALSHNSTGFREYEKAAIEAAYRNKYVPAMYGDKKIVAWTVCIYRFRPD